MTDQSYPNVEEVQSMCSKLDKQEEAKKIMEKMDEIVEEVPSSMEHESDARYVWPKRWTMLKHWLIDKDK